MNKHSILMALRVIAGVALSLSLTFGPVSPASAALRCYVNATASGLNDGSSWANAYTSPQSALANLACTAIWVAKGTYRPTTGTDRTISFHLQNGVAMYGGFAGNETSLSQRNPAANPTILSGNIGDLGSVLDNTYHVVDGTGTNSTARLDGFTITAGRADQSPWPHLVGGGLLNNPGSPSLANLIFSSHQSFDNGGAIFNWRSSPSLVNVTFINNTALTGGGGNASGGAIQNDDGSNPSLVNVTFINNQAIGRGGAMANVSSNPSLINVTFKGNSAGNFGGAMHNVFSSPSLTNVTFNGNTAATAGAIYNENSSNPIIRNSILYGDNGGEILNDSSTPIVTFSIVQGGFPGAGNLSANPLLRPLGNYGGFTKTMPLGYGSPAIDRGTNTGCPAADQRGILRPQDGDRNGTATCDMGATESRLFIKTFQSIGAQDGWVAESGENTNVGGSTNSSAETLSVGDGAHDEQGRSILSFDTSSLPDNVQLTSAVLKIKKQGLQGKDPFNVLGNLLVDVRKGAFSNNAALQLTDFQVLASKNAAITILSTNLLNGWYARAMPAANLVYINKLGLTQFRLRFALDDNNDNVADYLRFYSGNAATLSVRPVLIVKYYVP